MSKQLSEAERRARNKLIEEWSNLGTELMQNRSPKEREKIRKRIKELDKILDE